MLTVKSYPMLWKLQTVNLMFIAGYSTFSAAVNKLHFITRCITNSINMNEKLKLSTRLPCILLWGL